MVGGLLAAAFCLVDWLAILRGTRAKSVGIWHGAGNVALIALFIINCQMRGTAAPTPDTIALSVVAVGLRGDRVAGRRTGDAAECGRGRGCEPGCPELVGTEECATHSLMPWRHNFFVLTGGPGAGKTSLIEALHLAGYGRTVEAGRAIIQDQVAIGGNALPWADRALFAELMLSWDMRSHHLARQTQGPVFFDRGVVDVIAYCHVAGLPVPPHFTQAAEMFRYHRRAFLAPPWPEIYGRDRERKQDFAEAVRTCHAVTQAYGSQGYELIEIPRGPVEERVRFVLASAGLATADR